MCSGGILRIHWLTKLDMAGAKKADKPQTRQVQRRIVKGGQLGRLDFG